MVKIFSPLTEKIKNPRVRRLLRVPNTYRKKYSEAEGGKEGAWPQAELRFRDVWVGGGGGGEAEG